MAPPSYLDFVQNIGKQYGETNPYSIFGSALGQGSIRVDDPTASFGANLVKGLLSGGLQTYGAVQQRDYQNAAGDVLRSVLSNQDPSAIKTQSDLSDGDYGSLVKQANIFKDALAQERTQKLQDLDLQSLFAGKSKMQEKLGEFAAYDALSGKKSGDSSVGTGEKGAVLPGNTDGKLLSTGDLLNPAEQERRKLSESDRMYRNQVLQDVNQQLLNSDLGKGYKGVKSNFDSLLANMQQDDPYGNLGLINSFLKIKDPSSVNREGEVAALKDAQPRIERYLGGMKEAFGEGGALTPAAKLKILEAILPAYQSQAEQYNSSLYNPASERLKMSGFSEDEISKVLTGGKAQTYDPNNLLEQYKQKLGVTSGMGGGGIPGIGSSFNGQKVVGVKRVR